MTAREKFIVLLDNDLQKPSDAIILLEGDGFARYSKACELYKSSISKKIFFSGNFDDEKSGAYTFEKIKPLIVNAGIPEQNIFYENKSRNTYEQAVEIICIAKKSGWSRITLVASHYHTYRAFLTFLKVQSAVYPELLIDIASVKDLDWYDETGYGRRIDLLESEINKIDIYQRKDNVATYEEGIDYLKWKSQQQKK